MDEIRIRIFIKLVRVWIRILSISRSDPGPDFITQVRIHIRILPMPTQSALSKMAVDFIPQNLSAVKCK